MYGKFCSAVFLALLLTSLFAGVLNIQPLRTSETVIGGTNGSPGLGSSSSGPQQFSPVPTDIPGILSKAMLLGPVSPDMQLSLEFVLPLRSGVSLQSFLSEVYNPASPLYRHFLTPSQFYAFYGPDPNEVAALVAYMQSNGVQVHISPTNPNMVKVSGTVSQIQNALKTQIDSFSWNGQVFYSATSQAQLPSQFSNIQMIYGLENVSQAAGTGAVPLYHTLGTVAPSQTTGSSLGYSPSEIRQMYNATGLLNAGYTGTGVSIAIVDAYGDPYIQQELKNFSAEFGLPLSSGTLHIIPVGPYNATNGITYEWNTEVALDVEWAHAMAPNATINLYVASNDESYLYDAVLNATLGSNGAAYGVYHNNIISMSWGEPENNFTSSIPVVPGLNYPCLDQVFQMDAALGITAFAGSGDSGAYDQPQTSPYGGASYPSTDPYVTGVGGTSLYMNTTSGYYQLPYANATGTYGNETAWSWNNYYDYEWGTGGGWSTLFGQPSWQTGLGVVNNGERGAPDVAWDADPKTGVLTSVFDNATGLYDYYPPVGGTSVGSPCWAGSMALMDQKAGSPLGFINPTIYSILNNSTEYSKAFHDITVGDNNPDTATKGWDPLTGVGSPNLGELANYLAPTGQLPVVVTNDFSSVSDLGRAYAYGQIVNLTAIVANNRTISGPVTATITSSSGAKVASNVAMTYNALTKAWLGSYRIKATDPSGEWSVTVTAKNASSSGEGYTSFAVGDGVTILNPPSITGYFYQVGDTIHVDSYVVNTSDNNVTNGVYAATFYLAQNQTAGNELGKIEGKVTLQYNSLDSRWEGDFMVPKGADQGAWIMVVNGTDLNGNKGSAYTWINVGLDVSPFTDSPTYVLGGTISIFADTTYLNGSEVKKGTFTAVIYDGSTFVVRVPLTFYDLLGLWKGVFTTSSSGPTGFYTITVNGTDGEGNSGSFATVVRVARFRLSVQASLSSSVVPVQNGNESWVLAKVTYPGGSPMTVGSVIGYLYTDAGVLIKWFPMTYNSRAGGFVAINFFYTVNATVTWIGKYIVDVEAYDASGNYGNTTASFSVVDWWPMFHHDTAHIGYSTSAAPSTNQTLWTWTSKSGLPVISSPAVVNGVVYVGDTDGRVYALNATTGKQIWNHTTGGGVLSSPAVTGGIVYVGSFDDNIYALYATNGTKKWNFTTGSKVWSSPAVVGGVVYIGSEDNNVYAINATNGTKIWNYTTGGPIVSSPAVVGGVVYIGSEDNRTYALNATTATIPKSKRLLWKYMTGSWVASSPVVANGIVFVGSADDNVYALNAATGALVWKYATGWIVESSPAVANGVVYVSSMDGRVYAFGVHYVAVTRVVQGVTFCPLYSCYAFAPAVGRGFSDIINVTVSNSGSSTETFTVTFYANATAIATQAVTLAVGASTNVTLDWNTAGFAFGNYTISASVTLAPGETNSWTGPFTYGTVQITKVGNLGSRVNGTNTFGMFSGTIGPTDLSLFLQCYHGTAPAQWMYLADLGSRVNGTNTFFVSTHVIGPTDLSLFLQCYHGTGP